MSDCPQLPLAAPDPGPRYILTLQADVTGDDSRGVGRWVKRLGDRAKYAEVELGTTTCNRAIVQTATRALLDSRAERLPVVLRTCNQAMVQAMRRALAEPHRERDTWMREFIEAVKVQGVPVSIEYVAKDADPDLRALRERGAAA